MQSEVLPSELQLVPPPTIPQARSYMFKQQSELQEYDVLKGNRIRINIPRLQRSYLMKESYIRFRLNIDFTTTSPTQTNLYLDRCGAYGLFERIEVYDYLGGTLLEQTNNIPALVTLLGDTENGVTDFNGELQAMRGYNGSTIHASISNVDSVDVRTSNGGRRFYKYVGGDTFGAKFATVEFCLPVMSFLGNLSDKYVPLHNGFSVDFFLNNASLALVSRKDKTDNVPTAVTLDEVWISNFEYCCQVMELGEQAEAMVLAIEPFVVPAQQYRHFRDTILGGGTQSSFRTDMNLNVVSLRNIFFSMRPEAYQSLSYPSYGHRMRNFLTNWNFQYGSSYLPEVAGINTRATFVPLSRKGTENYAIGSQGRGYYKALSYNQCLAELLKTGTSLTTLNNSIQIEEFMIDTNCKFGGSTFSGALTGPDADVPFIDIDSLTICGKFAGGLNTQLSKKSAISGIDTNGLLVSVNGTFDPELGIGMEQALLDIWAEHDAFIQIVPGVATTVTF